MAARAPKIKNTIAMAPPIRQGRLRGIAQMGEKRSCVLPDLPTLDQLGMHGAQIGGWYGLYAPAKSPKEVVAKLHADITSVLARSDIRERCGDQGAELVAGSLEQLAAFVRRESALYAKIIQSSGIRVD